VNAGKASRKVGARLRPINMNLRKCATAARQKEKKERPEIAGDRRSIRK